MKTTIESSGRMHNPAHPGEILRQMYMGPLGVTITQTADALGVSRKHVSAIVNAAEIAMAPPAMTIMIQVARREGFSLNAAATKITNVSASTSIHRQGD